MQVSGKDLINNHLSFCMYTHTAIWEDKPHRWPRAFRCNGHIKVNGEKMSKSLGEPPAAAVDLLVQLHTRSAADAVTAAALTGSAFQKPLCMLPVRALTAAALDGRRTTSSKPLPCSQPRTSHRSADTMAAPVGNFRTLRGAVQEYSSDGLRMCLAVAGDAMSDANFEDKVRVPWCPVP